MAERGLNGKHCSLMDSHAKNGFLRMPAKGKDARLKQTDIADAVFYMTQKLQGR